MNVLTLDFETFWSKDYSLSKMTTEAYVRDPRFRAHLVGLKAGDGPTRWVDGGRFRQVAAQIPWHQTAVLAQHAQFDGLILSHHYDVRPALWLDTLSMARIALPGEKHSLHKLARRFDLPVVEKAGLGLSYGKVALSGPELAALAEDCCRDCDLTWAVFNRLKAFVPRDELRLIDLTVRMFVEPVLRLDRPRMERHHADVVASKTKALVDLGVVDADLQSSEKFAQLLRQCGVEPPMKPNTKGEPIYAFAKTDDGMRELAEHVDGRVQALAAARLGAKSTLDESRAERLLGMVERGRLAVYLRHAGAHTLRWSGGDSLNWQNFPRRGEIRKSILAPEGEKLVVGDLAQIECRMVNWLAGQQDVVERFARGHDPYIGIASQFYGFAVTKANPLERHLGKTIELGCGFGMGRSRFQETCRRGPLGGAPIHLTEDEAARAVDLYRSTHQAVVALWRQGETALWALQRKVQLPWGPMHVADRAVWLPGGAPLFYRQLEEHDGELMLWTGRAWTKMYGAKLVENVVQALAAVVLKEAMLRIARRYRIVLTVHDEVMVIADEGDTEALEFVLGELRRVPAWAEGLPLDAEGMEGVRYEK